MVFENREEAGKLLSAKLLKYKNRGTIVLGIPRGGVVVAAEIAKELHLPLNILIVRKITHPAKAEFGLGAIAEGNVQILDRRSIDILGVSKKDLKEAIKKEKEELNRRVALYRAFKKFPILKNKNVILVDDGLATGVSAKAAIRSLRGKGVSKIILVTPVCAQDTCWEIESMVGNFICLNQVEDLEAIGFWYKEFYPVEDEEVIKLLKNSN